MLLNIKKGDDVRDRDELNCSEEVREFSETLKVGMYSKRCDIKADQKPFSAGQDDE